MSTIHHWLLTHARVSAFFFLSLLIGTAYAVDLTTTPNNLQPGDEAVLRAYISSSATSLTLNPIKKYVNGTLTTGCFNTGSGFLLIEDLAGRKEYASFNGNSCDSSNITTLSSIRRGLSPTSASFAAGTGMEFDAGAKVKLTDYPLFYNNALYKDLKNTLTGSGRIVGTQTNFSIIDLPCITSTQRDNLLDLSDGQMICNSTLNTFQLRIGSAWYSFGSGSIVNATELVGGKVELGRISDQSGATVTGDSGAPVVVQTQYLTASGGSTARKRIPLLDNRGYASGTYLSTNYNALTVAQRSTNYLRADQTYALPPVSSGANLVYNLQPIATPSVTNGTSTTFAGIMGGDSIPDWSVGDTALMMFTCNVIRGSATAGWVMIDIKINNNPISRGGSGALVIGLNDTEQTLRKNASFTLINRIQTGGTLTFTPVYKVAGSPVGATFGPPCQLQVLKFE